MLDKVTQRMLDTARRYAAADRSDPFVLDRACAHIRNGIVSLHNANNDEALYDAEPRVEMRVHAATGERYPATVYTNLRRP